MAREVASSTRLAEILVLLTAFAVSGCTTGATAQQGAPGTQNAEIPSGLSKAEFEAVTEAVKRQLKKPEAAELKWLAVPASARGNSQAVLTYCGMVNSMTAVGTYTGFRPFYAIVVTYGDGSASADVLSPPPDAALDQSQPARLACTEAGYEMP